jgi:DNA-binding transcriptional MocR family regulator
MPKVGKATKESIRLCFTWLEREELVEAVKRIQRTIKYLRE